MINGTKVSKKLSLDDESDAKKSRKSWRTHLRNGMVAKSKRRRNLWRKGKKGTELFVNVADEEENEFMGSDSLLDKISPQDDKQDIDDNDAVIENIMEPIKKKKENIEKKTSKFIEVESIMSKKATIKKTLSERRDGTPTTDRIFFSSQDNGKFDDNCTSRETKRQRMNKISRSNMKNTVKIDIATNASKMAMSGLRKSTRNSTKVLSKIDDHETDDTRNKVNNKFNYDSPPESCDETECVPKNTVSKFGLSDEEVIEEQQRIERLLLQEREDFELAQRLQAQFDEMERIAGRTRRSRQVTENTKCTEVSSREFDMAKTVNRASARKTAQRNSTVNGTANAKRKRGRPPKRMKITLNACENETRTR